MNKIKVLVYIVSITASLQVFSQIHLPQYEKPKGMIRGGEFEDLILPTPIINGLETNLWGADGVLPRDADNGLEDSIYSYWGGNIIKGDDGNYHAFVVITSYSIHYTKLYEKVHSSTFSKDGPWGADPIPEKNRSSTNFLRPIKIDGKEYLLMLGTSYNFV